VQRPEFRIYCRIIEKFEPQISHSKWQYISVPALFSIQRATRHAASSVMHPVLQHWLRP
jgi:hypothetical protein